jgi:hypothetical protein
MNEPYCSRETQKRFSARKRRSETADLNWPASLAFRTKCHSCSQDRLHRSLFHCPSLLVAAVNRCKASAQQLTGFECCSYFPLVVYSLGTSAQYIRKLATCCTQAGEHQRPQWMSGESLSASTHSSRPTWQ